ncbi:MAG: helix-turn-helix domain-containing protein, partial [Lachnospiraceae bacterium]|nr:helix-turn-helix domain-containing protein [Lachnospiraceae bacterium]
MMEHRGNLKTLELAKELNISSRQMERVFDENMGVTPKKAASLIRYQYLWQEICFNPQFNIQDAVFQYGYTDQAHLLHDFKKFHGLPLGDAIKYAHVDFLQDKNLNIK